VKVRKAKPKDKKQIIELITEVDNLFVPPLHDRDSYEGYYKYTVCENPEYIKKHYNFDKYPEKHISYIAKHRDEVIGYCSAFTKFELINDAHCSTGMISKKYQGMGIIKKLLKKILKDLEKNGASSVSTQTWSTNVSVIKVLYDFNFKIYRTVPNERAPEIDGLYLIKKFH